jgi:SagB-type dehydrogenase family enzyme
LKLHHFSQGDNMRAIALFLLAAFLPASEPANKPIKLPAPKMGTATLDSALKERRSNRALTGPALSMDELSQLLWSAQGQNRPGTNGRTVPSASARYPLELYVVVAKSEQLAEGIYRYSTKEHSITKIKDGGPQTFFGAMSPIQPWIPKAQAVFIFSGVESRMRDYENNYSNARELYTFWESGAAAQSLCLQVAALDLGATVVLAANLPAIKKAAGLPDEERISVIVPVGRIAK